MLGISNTKKTVICYFFLLHHASGVSRPFHTTTAVLGGRKTGSNAHEPESRSLSKKQEKKKRNRLQLLTEKRNPQKERLSKALTQKHMQSKEVIKLAENSQESLNNFLEVLKNPLTDEMLTKLLGESTVKSPTDLMQSKDELPHIKYQREQLELAEDLNIDPKIIIQDLKNISRVQLSNNEDTKHSYQTSVAVDLSLSSLSYASNIGLFCNLAIFASVNSSRDLIAAKELLSLMHIHSIPVTLESYNEVMSLAHTLHEHNYVYGIFNDRLLASDNMIPDSHSWSLYICSKADNNQADEALKIIDTVLKENRILPTIEMFNSILKKFLAEKRFDDIEKLWIRMHQEYCPLNLDSFHTMIRYSTMTSQAEKAFFLFDELTHLQLKPTLDTYIHLIRASAEAPHWVHGFHDIIFDAMLKLEGSEMKPTTAVYNAIIHAFGKACDGFASEFYYWEMIRKGLQPDISTYNSLLYSYAKSCSVGARYYGYKGRWVRPLERKYTPDEQALADIGPDIMNKHLSANITSDGPLDRGSRQHSKIEDMLEDDDENIDSMMEIIKSQARNINKYKSFKEKREESKRLQYEEQLRLEYEQFKTHSDGGLDSFLKSISEGVSDNDVKDLDFNSGDEDQDFFKNLNSNLDDFDLKSLLTSRSDSNSPTNSSHLPEVVNGGEIMKRGRKRLEKLSSKPLDRHDNITNEIPLILSDSSRKSLLDDEYGTDIRITSEDLQEFTNGQMSNDQFDEVVKQSAEVTSGRRRKPILGRRKPQIINTTESAHSMNDIDLVSSRVSDSIRGFNASELSAMTQKSMKSAEKYIEQFRGVDSKQSRARALLNARTGDDDDYSVSVSKTKMQNKSQYQSPAQTLFESKSMTPKYKPDPDSEYARLFKQKYTSSSGLRKVQDSMRLSDEFEDPFVGVIPVAGPSSLGNEALRDQQRLMNNPLLSLLDGEDLSSNSTANKLKSDKAHVKLSESMFTQEGDEWDLVEYGKAPDPDYTIPFHIRRQLFVNRANALFNKIVPSKAHEPRLSVTVTTLNSYMYVLAEAFRVDEAMNIFKNSFKTMKLKPDNFTYKVLIRMFIRKKDLDSALKCKQDADKKNIMLLGESYGILIESCMHRDKVVEALKLFEEASSKKLRINEKYLKVLRGRCRNLRVEHPDLANDPNQWVRDTKEMNKRMKGFSNSVVQELRSAVFK